MLSIDNSLPSLANRAAGFEYKLYYEGYSAGYSFAVHRHFAVQRVEGNIPVQYEKCFSIALFKLLESEWMAKPFLQFCPRQSSFVDPSSRRSCDIHFVMVWSNIFSYDFTYNTNTWFSV